MSSFSLNGMITKSEHASKQMINWHDNIQVPDIHVPWLYEAHSLILLTIVLFVILYTCFTMEGSIQLGIGLNIFFFLSIGCLVFPAGPFIRPHPIFWRFIFSFSLLYSFFLLFLLAQTPNNARAALRYVFNDNTLGYPLPERSYAVDCRLKLNVFISVCDRFLFAHFIGWALKAAIIRDRTILWILSVLWEIIELATKYFIPNFAECWWDQLILDVLICNAFGIEFGLFIAHKWYKFSPRHWAGKGLFDIKSICLKFRRLFIQFTPRRISPMKWEPLSNLKRFYQIHLFILVAVFLDLNAFLLKLFLFIPTEHSLNIWRILMIFFIFMVAAKQYYLYLTDDKCQKIGSQMWVCILILVLEFALSYKCAPNPFPSAPKINKICWSISFILYLIFTYVMFRDLRHVKIDKKNE